ncbi:hypothetical protein Peur_074455 [Populus x canadensis]
MVPRTKIACPFFCGNFYCSQRLLHKVGKHATFRVTRLLGNVSGQNLQITATLSLMENRNNFLLAAGKCQWLLLISHSTANFSQ